MSYARWSKSMGSGENADEELRGDCAPPCGSYIPPHPDDAILRIGRASRSGNRVNRPHCVRQESRAEG